MSHKVTDALFEMMRLGRMKGRSSLRWLLICFAYFARDDGSEARPSLATLCRMTGQDKATVIRGLRDIRSEKSIVTVERVATNLAPTVHAFNVKLLRQIADEAIAESKGAPLSVRRRRNAVRPARHLDDALF